MLQAQCDGRRLHQNKPPQGGLFVGKKTVLYGIFNKDSKVAIHGISTFYLVVSQA